MSRAEALHGFYFKKKTGIVFWAVCKVCASPAARRAPRRQWSAGGGEVWKGDSELWASPNRVPVDGAPLRSELSSVYGFGYIHVVGGMSVCRTWGVCKSPGMRFPGVFHWAGITGCHESSLVFVFEADHPETRVFCLKLVRLSF